jgi:hypothetical protein
MSKAMQPTKLKHIFNSRKLTKNYEPMKEEETCWVHASFFTSSKKETRCSLRLSYFFFQSLRRTAPGAVRKCFVLF